VRRNLVSLAVVVALVAATVLCGVRLERIPRETLAGRDLLYLPSPEMLKLVSLGHPEIVADALYLWSIQYYSQFQPHERFLYLETVYNLITDLDPRYFDAYRIGALIMEIQVGGDDDKLEQSVRRLFDKGLHNLPKSWKLAEAAAWDMYIRFRDRKAALHYAEIAAKLPGAPARLKRIVGVWRDAENDWTIDDSIAYWRQAAADAVDAYDRGHCLSHLYDAIVVKDRQRLDPLLQEYSARTGSCAHRWEELISAGMLREVPTDMNGTPYGIDPQSCTIVAYKKIRDQ
jgi:hypothetical protein